MSTSTWSMSLPVKIELSETDWTPLRHVLMTVMDIDIVDPDPVMFPGLIKKGIAMHAGFMRAHAS